MTFFIRRTSVTYYLTFSQLTTFILPFSSE